MTSQQIRQQFLDFFAAKGHSFVPSSPVVPHDDPTLMFANAGMNQFKPIFLGTARVEHPRVVNSQKCIRAGGKHNDLDDVGQDTYHHTFFEMLGNWSFGDYFKKEAIEWAWELLTKVWGIDKSRLHATYFGGNSEVQSSKFKVQSEGPASDFELRTSNFVLEPDYESRDLWTSMTDIDPSHVHPGSMKDNFWEMGDTGPCGPCSEIHIDLTPDKSGAVLVNKGDARVIELWNLVFIQFNRGSDGKLTPLPAKHVDTGMGFERLCAVLQRKSSNYDTDVFTPLFEAIRTRTGAPAYQGTLPTEPRASARAETGKSETQSESNGPRGLKSAAREIGNRQSTILVDVSYRVIADHLRCLVFALTDGAVPSNEGRGYVLRRILRRAVRYGRQYLNMHEPFLCDLVPTVVEHMVDVFPELRNAHNGKNVQHVTELIREEESSFIKTLDRGIRIFDAVAKGARLIQKWPFERIGVNNILSVVKQAFYKSSSVTTISWHGWDRLSPPERIYEEIMATAELDKLVRGIVEDMAHHRGVIPGRVAFLLHDTYGFPIDLTELMAEEQGLTIDLAEYERLMEAARNRARSVGFGVMAARRWTHRDVPQELVEPFGRTNDEAKFDTGPIQGTVLAIIEFDGNRPVLAESMGRDLSDKSYPFVGGVLVLDRTCFYAEQGGQVGDWGDIVVDGCRFLVTDTHYVGPVVLHIGTCQIGTISVGRPAAVLVALRRRIPTMQNHTATHMLNWALREVLGEHVQQKGSLVDPEKTRFDFSHNKQLSEDELSRIERHVQSQISDAFPVLTMPDADQKQAREINTLRAVFGEKYPDKVRVVSIGADIDSMLRDPKNPKWMKYSVEFCGGTHLKNSKEAEEFVLVSEEGVAKGVRRVVGVTGERAKEARQRGEFFLEVSDKLLTEDQSSKFKVQEGADPHGGPYDLARLLKEIAEAQIPVLTRHRLADSIAVLQEAAKEHQKKSEAQAQRGAVEAVADLLASKAVDVAGVTVLVAEVPHGNADALRSGIDYVRNKKGSSGVLLATVDEGRVTLVAGMSKDLVERGIKAGDLIKEICPLVGGKGGGRPDMAQGGGTDPKGLPQALERATEWIANKLSA